MFSETENLFHSSIDGATLHSSYKNLNVTKWWYLDTYLLLCFIHCQCVFFHNRGINYVFCGETTFWFPTNHQFCHNYVATTSLSKKTFFSFACYQISSQITLWMHCKYLYFFMSTATDHCWYWQFKLFRCGIFSLPSHFYTESAAAGESEEKQIPARI